MKHLLKEIEIMNLSTEERQEVLNAISVIAKTKQKSPDASWYELGSSGSRHGDNVEVSDNAKVDQVVHIDNVVTKWKGDLLLKCGLDDEGACGIANLLRGQIKDLKDKKPGKN